jgi:hypothetical protein
LGTERRYTALEAQVKEAIAAAAAVRAAPPRAATSVGRRFRSAVMPRREMPPLAAAGFLLPGIVDGWPREGAHRHAFLSVDDHDDSCCSTGGYVRAVLRKPLDVETVALLLARECRADGRATPAPA